VEHIVKLCPVDSRGVEYRWVYKSATPRANPNRMQKYWRLMWTVTQRRFRCRVEGHDPAYKGQVGAGDATVVGRRWRKGFNVGRRPCVVFVKLSAQLNLKWNLKQDSSKTVPKLFRNCFVSVSF